MILRCDDDGRLEWRLNAFSKYRSMWWHTLVVFHLGMGEENIEIKGNIKSGNQSRNSILMSHIHTLNDRMATN